MKEAREHIAAAGLFTLLVVGPASLIADIIRVVSDNKAIASLVFCVAVAVELLIAARWVGKQTARQEQETNSIAEAHMTVHGFIAYIKMHPALLPVGMTEFDLERFRKVCSEKDSQAEFGDWMRQLINSATVS